MCANCLLKDDQALREMSEASYDDGLGLRSNSKSTNHCTTSGTCLIFMSITQMMIGFLSIMVAVMLTETAATHSTLSKANGQPKLRIQLKTPEVRIHIDNAKTLNRDY